MEVEDPLFKNIKNFKMETEKHESKHQVQGPVCL